MMLRKGEEEAKGREVEPWERQEYAKERRKGCKGKERRMLKTGEKDARSDALFTLEKDKTRSLTCALSPISLRRQGYGGAETLRACESCGSESGRCQREAH